MPGPNKVSPPTVVLPTGLLYDVMSGVTLRESDGLSAGFYVAGNWPDGGNGGTIYYSTDGENWSAGGNVTDRTDMGQTTSALPPFTEDPTITTPVLDTTSTLNVALTGGLLASTSASDAANGGNACLVGTEIITFEDAVALTGAYELTQFYRGWQGTDRASGQASGVRFWHLTASVVWVPVAAALVGQTVQVAVLGPGQSFSQCTPVSVVIAANNYPYARPGDVANASSSSLKMQYALMGV